MIREKMYEKVSIIVTSNKSFENWAEMIGDSVMITALLDRLLHHDRIFNLEGKITQGLAGHHDAIARFSKGLKRCFEKHLLVTLRHRGESLG